MKAKDFSGLFTIGQLARACNISRATILRFEEDGLLEPEYINSESGYRYYSCNNMARILSILKFQNVGFTKKQIKSMDDPSQIEELIKQLHFQHMLILRELEDLTARGSDPDTVQVQKLETLGGTFFFRRREMLYTPENIRSLALETIEAFIEARLTGNTHQSMKIFIEDMDTEEKDKDIVSIGQFDGKMHRCIAVIPTLTPQNGEDFISIDPCPALTISCKCDYNDSEDLFFRVWHEAGERGMTPDGPVCIAGFPEIFFSSDTKMSDSTLRLMLRTKRG